MNTWAVVGIIILVLAIIWGNVLLLKHSANTKFASPLTESKKQSKDNTEKEQ